MALYSKFHFETYYQCHYCAHSMYCRWQCGTYSRPGTLLSCLQRKPFIVLRETSHFNTSVFTPDIFCRCGGSPKIACGSTPSGFHNQSQWSSCHSPFVTNKSLLAVLTLHFSTVTLTERQLDSEWACQSISREKKQYFQTDSHFFIWKPVRPNLHFTSHNESL